ncbi:MAG: DNA repair protein RecO [Endozoicomonadaceae bacterium]|nr:DNA repair protein RecO [Endozoicomonadaceae bacterium]
MSISALHPAWVLHCFPYKESSVIADILTADAGRVSLIAHNIKKQNKKKFSGTTLQLFQRFQISWRGNGNLKTLTNIEADKSLRLQGRHLFCGLYANELLVRLLKHHLPSQEIFRIYEWLIIALSKKVTPESCLRLFEKGLLDQLGYGLPLQFEAETLIPLQPNQHYTYNPLNGFSRKTEHDDLVDFPGWLLLNYAKNQISEEMLPLLKQLNRMALKCLLGNEPLKSRSLFKTINQK